MQVVELRDFEVNRQDEELERVSESFTRSGG
jgi:hypothetical protein